MKRTIKTWLGAVLAAGIVWAQPLALLAQETEAAPADVQPVAAPAVSTNETGVLAGSLNVSDAPSEDYRAQKRRGPVVSIGGRATLAAGESAETIVAVGGSAK